MEERERRVRGGVGDGSGGGCLCQGRESHPSASMSSMSGSGVTRVMEYNGTTAPAGIVTCNCIHSPLHLYQHIHIIHIHTNPPSHSSPADGLRYPAEERTGLGDRSRSLPPVRLDQLSVNAEK